MPLQGKLDFFPEDRAKVAANEIAEREAPVHEELIRPVTGKALAAVRDIFHGP